MAVMNVPDDPEITVEFDETLTLNFKHKVHLWFSQPTAIQDGLKQPLPHDQDRDSSHPWGPGTVNTGGSATEVVMVAQWTDSASSSVSHRRASVFPFSTHVIHIGSGPLMIDVLRNLELDKDFCKCWGSTERLLSGLLKEHSLAIPDAAEEFIESLIKAGNKVCGAESKEHKKQ